MRTLAAQSSVDWAALLNNTGCPTSVQFGSHALVGGVVSKLQGGNFGHGFFRAEFTKWAGKTWHIDRYAYL